MPQSRFGPGRLLRAKPRTYVGMWLRAGLLGENETRRELAGKLNGGRDGWNYDEPAVVEAACELAVRRFFSADVDARDITAIAEDMQQKSKALPGSLEVEAVIRSALGEPEVVIDDIRPPDLMHIRAAVIGYLVINLKANFAVDELIAEAENVAFKRGWHPPLAT